MRKQFGKTICDLAERDPRVVLVTGDIGYGIFDDYRARFPERFINLGICEQSMIGFAAGMALEGFKPYVYTITPFLIERAFEQIKLDVDQQRTNVKLVGFADYPKGGPTHTELDARGLMSLLKNTTSYFPINSAETQQFLEESYTRITPAFINLKSEPKTK